MTILITGGTGFLGSYFTRYAVNQGENVVLLDRYADRGRIADVLDRVTVIEGDVADFDPVAKILADHCVDRIAHFAFILGSPKPGQMLPYVQVQCAGTATVLEAARLAGVARVLFASSVAAYGHQTADILTEDLVPNPSDPYGICKAWGEAMGRHYQAKLGLDFVSLRFGSTYGYGRGRRGSFASGMLDAQPQVHYMARLDDAVRGHAIEMPRGDALADWTYAGDAAQAVWLALTKPDIAHSLYNVASERSPVGDFTRILRDLLPGIDIAESQTELPNNAHAPMSNARLLGDLGFKPAYSLEDGVRDYIERVRAYDRYQGEHG
ncbi:MAG: NAD(P)-dependent oxidoreductase [Sphingobium sp.]